ncbi:outer membrane lipoprotein-sorting protein [Marinomonas algarum]|uniref:Outer membrane lipoprotein-sorting protein n=1 Tax=Marinomonas algarum TaxID=2883105 RepID=A0A9X1IM26_9GAMM|nr:outer membrane lipoprotein-sorting protein [Marinomonas algarum]MCB5161690.1 outer membrane lipoprotein-sorting protein [Marinomonas algarum]
MKLRLLLIMVVFGITCFNNTFAAEFITAYDIIKRSDQQMRGKSSYNEITMNIIRPDWQRSMSMKSWSKGTGLSLVLVTAPANEKGSASLKRQNEMWNWVPRIEKIIKIAPSMLSQSWMGSDFTNDDLINQSSIVVDYHHTLMSEESVEGDTVWVIEADAKIDAPVVWSKVVLWISKTTYLQRKVEFYDEFGDLVNTLLTGGIKEMGGRMVPTQMSMLPADKPGYETEMITHAAQFDFDISDNFFSQRQMKALRD